jgi:ABC-type transporter Mla subunit MlaD
MKPLQQSLNSKDRTITYTEADIKTLFSNLEVVIPLNVELLKELTTIVGNWSEQQKIGATFLRMAPFLKMYYEYSIAYNTALDTYNRLVRDQNFAQRLLVSLIQIMNSFLVVLTRFFSQNYRTESGINLSLEHLLIMPVQRMPRYVMLLTVRRPIIPIL